MAKTKIEWATDIWNPVSGCTPISEGCQNCYAARFAKRLAGRCGYPKDDPFRVTLHPERLEEPLRWKKPRRVFVCSMGDLFHEDVPFEFIDKVFAVMGRCWHHTFLLLTKRPERLQSYVKSGRYQQVLDVAYSLSFRPEGLGMGISNPKDMRWWPHVWLGVTAENQARADERIPILLQIPAAVRFVSVEPMLGPIDLRNYLWTYHCQECNECFEYAFGIVVCPKCGGSSISVNDYLIDWVICGGETGPGARPMHPDWARNLRDQCQEAGVPFFFKQWGQWNDLSSGNWVAPRKKDTRAPWIDSYVLSHRNKINEFPDGCRVFNMGKKAAGRLLDGRTWDEMPK